MVQKPLNSFPHTCADGTKIGPLLWGFTPYYLPS